MTDVGKKLRRLFSVMLAAIMLVVIMPMEARAEATVFNVGNQDELLSAFNAINAAGSGEFKIYLGDDIEFDKGPDVLNLTGDAEQTITIYGEGHTLSLKKTSLFVKGSATLNLGSVNYKNSLTICSADSTRSIINLGGNAVLNMYENVTIGGNASFAGGQASGVQLEGNSTFNMYGGTITDCHNWASVAGGVFLDGNSKFIMRNGVISNCSGWQGGGVGVAGNSTFTMEGGEIKDCSDVWYGGGGVNLYAYGASFIMNGGKITGCTGTNKYGYGGALFACTVTGEVQINSGEITGNSAFLGGGILVLSGNVSVADGVKIYNNSASKAGDDIYNNTGSSLTLSKVTSGLKLNGCDHVIDGWYVDGVLNGEKADRWCVNPCVECDENHAVELEFLEGETTIEITTEIALKAAHGENPSSGEEEKPDPEPVTPPRDTVTIVIDGDTPEKVEENPNTGAPVFSAAVVSALAAVRAAI